MELGGVCGRRLAGLVMLEATAHRTDRPPGPLLSQYAVAPGRTLETNMVGVVDCRPHDKQLRAISPFDGRLYPTAFSRLLLHGRSLLPLCIFFSRKKVAQG